jgi:hypothetical protein
MYIKSSSKLEKNIFEISKKQHILNKGSYLVILKSLKDGLGRSWDNRPGRPSLSFIFETIEPINEITITRTVPVSQREGSTCISFIRQLSGINQPSFDITQDGEALLRHINSLVGQRFIAQIEPSKDGRFNNIVGITSASENTLLLASGE